MAAAALDNAKTRLLIGWPLLLLALALYTPADGVTRLVLLAAGTLLVVRAVPTAKASNKPSGAKPSTPRPATGPKRSSGSSESDSVTTKPRSAPAGTVPRQRGPKGRWTK